MTLECHNRSPNIPSVRNRRGRYLSVSSTVQNRAFSPVHTVEGLSPKSHPSLTNRLSSHFPPASSQSVLVLPRPPRSPQVGVRPPLGPPTRNSSRTVRTQTGRLFHGDDDPGVHPETSETPDVEGLQWCSSEWKVVRSVDPTKESVRETEVPTPSYSLPRVPDVRGETQEPMTPVVSTWSTGSRSPTVRTRVGTLAPPFTKRDPVPVRASDSRIDVRRESYRVVRGWSRLSPRVGRGVGAAHERECLF